MSCDHRGVVSFLKRPDAPLSEPLNISLLCVMNSRRLLLSVIKPAGGASPCSVPRWFYRLVCHRTLSTACDHVALGAWCWRTRDVPGSHRWSASGSAGMVSMEAPPRFDISLNMECLHLSRTVLYAKQHCW